MATNHSQQLVLKLWKTASVLAALGAAIVLVAPAWAADHFDEKRYAGKPAEWFRGAEGSQVVANVLSHQSDLGGWPKNVDTAAAPSTEEPPKIKGTFDNGATTGELRFLARALRASGDARCRAAFDRGLELILQAQYPTGGWPQFYPPPKNTYHRHITFNDDAMVRLLVFLRDVARAPGFDFVAAERRAAARSAFDRGIDCIVKCQIKVQGKLTVWCAQHDSVDLSPQKGRAYELATLSGAESAGILRLLMSLEKPSPEVVRAIHAGAAWFASAAVHDVRQTVVDGDKKIVADSAAPPLWARFYEIGSGRPIFCDRDGVAKYNIADIGHERRNGYAWYGNWGESVAKEYARWKEKRPLP